MILVKFEKEIKGTAEVEGYKDWIEFRSYSLNVSRNIQVQGADRDVATAYISEFSLTKVADKTSPEFFIQSAVGTAFDKVTIVVLHAAGGDKPAQKLATFVLTKPIVSSFSTTGVADSRPEEHMSLNFINIDYEYYHFDGDVAKGSSKKSYDVIAKAAKAA